MADPTSSFAQQGGGGSQNPGSSKPTYSKRGKITIVACVPCRRRKTKCDGRRPSCSQCQTRDSPCQYDMNEEQRRLTFLRENVESLAEEKNTLEAFLWHLRGSNENESLEILRRLRSGSDPQTLVQQIQASRSLTQVKGETPSFSQNQHPGNASCQSTDAQSLHMNRILQYDSFLDFPRLNMPSPALAHERIIHAIATSSTSETDELVQRLRRREPLDRIVENIDSSHHSRSSSAMDLDPTPTYPGQIPAYQARPMAGNALAPEVVSQRTTGSTRMPDAHTPPNSEGYRWTNVTEDRELIEHLLDVYFMWQHSFFQNFPEFLFRHDYEAGKTKYCSRVLVNAICAAGCLLSDRLEARGDPYDPTTAGAGFFEEGMMLLNRADKSSIPSTAGVFILSHVEGYRARLGAMWGLVGRSARMALDLNLHLRNDKVAFDDMPPSMQIEENGRIHAFWGCFVSDQYVISLQHKDSPD
jgi:transcription factor-like protein/Zn(2)-Cys(6) binuclear cluster domain-containing protein